MGQRRVKGIGAVLLLALVAGAPGAGRAGAPARGAGSTVRKPAAQKPPPRSGAPAEALRPFGGAAFLLPVGAEISARWILPPTEKGHHRPLLAVDGAGVPLLGVEDRLLSPLHAWVATLGEEPGGMAYLAGGALVVALGRELGVVALPTAAAQDAKGVPRVAFQPFAAAPLRRIEVLASAGADVLCAGFDPGRGKYAVYLLRSAKGVGPQELQRIHESDERITALAGDGAWLYAAAGRTVVRIARRDGSRAVRYVHPTSPVDGLAVTPGGLMVSTGTELVRVGDHGAVELMRSPAHRIVAQGGRLYVLFSRSLGLVALDGLASLAKFDVPVSPVSATQVHAALAVAEPRFFETTGPAAPPASEAAYASRFDRESVHRLVARLDWRADLPAPARTHTVTVSWYEPTGGRLWSADYAVVSGPRARAGTLYADIGVDPKEGYTPAWQPEGSRNAIGDDALGSRYPGRYSLAVLVDGVPAAEGTFTLTGTAKPFEAIFYDDVDGLKAMLAGGLDPRASVPGAAPLLNLATRWGSVRSMAALLDAGADPNARDQNGDPPLAACNLAGAAWQEKAELLLRRGARVNALARSDEPLVHAAFSPEVVVFLLRHGADAQARSAITGETLVEAAVSSDSCAGALLGELKVRGLDLNATGRDGSFTPLGRAILSKREACVSALVGLGASLDRADRSLGARGALALALDVLKDDRTPPARRVVQLLIEGGGKLAPKERWRMFEGDNASLFDPAALVAAVLADDAALEQAGKSAAPEIREMALRAHLAKAREETDAAVDEQSLRDAHGHCDAAFALAEATWPRLEQEVVPERLPSGAPALGVSLVPRKGRGAYLQAVAPGGAGARAGLQAGDVLLMAGDGEVNSALDLAGALGQAAPGQPVRLQLLRSPADRLPELPLICGLLEERLGMRDLAKMNLTRAQAGRPTAP